VPPPSATIPNRPSGVMAMLSGAPIGEVPIVPAATGGLAVRSITVNVALEKFATKPFRPSGVMLAPRGCGPGGAVVTTVVALSSIIDAVELLSATTANLASGLTTMSPTLVVPPRTGGTAADLPTSEVPSAIVILAEATMLP